MPRRKEICLTQDTYIKYQTFIEGHREANPQIKKEEQLRAAQALWKSVRKEPEKIRQMMCQFKEKAKNREKIKVVEKMCFSYS
jgi:hypothetical protein